MVYPPSKLSRDGRLIRPVVGQEVNPFAAGRATISAGAGRVAPAKAKGISFSAKILRR
jgi:hypothetical protein